LLVESDFDVRAFSTPQEFLSQHDPAVPGCAVFDVAMPGLDGLELQSSLATGNTERPVIFITGVGDVPTSVRAMKAGAIDFLTKPVSDEELLGAIARATEKDAEARKEQGAAFDQRTTGKLRRASARCSPMSSPVGYNK
jgi:FixJ family two-component response regulator